MRLGNLRCQGSIENIDKQFDERNQINIIDENISDERKQKGENDEDRSIDDVEVLKLGTLCSKIDIYIILKDNLMKETR